MEEQHKPLFGGPVWATSGGTGGCPQEGPQPEDIRTAIRSKYTEVAGSASGKFAYPTGREGALALAYEPAIVDAAPAAMLASFCGVGNPFTLGPIHAGSRVLDIGCGAGFDLFVAARLAGPDGRVSGVDLTEAMVLTARQNLAQAGIANAEVLHVTSEALPFPDNTFDAVLSNGVINLSPAKDALFAEILRVLKPGGRLAYADVVLEQALPEGAKGSAEAWSQWVGGTVPVGDHLLMLRKAGFRDILFTGLTGFRTSPATEGALFKAVKPLG